MPGHNRNSYHMAYRPMGHELDVVHKISAFSSNLAITTCQTLMPGQTITGIIGATYGTHLTAQLEAWKPCDWRGWDKMSDHPAPDWEDIDLNP